jgi:surface antigen
LWWDNAAGMYARGQVPEDGAVLSFRANRSMPLGHVAVVKNIVNRREIEIDHANWAGPRGRKGRISRGVSVVDVSENNDWTAVRVELGQSGNYGSIYPTNGFIYERPDDGGIMMASLPTVNARGPVALTPAAAAPLAGLNPAPRDLRPAEVRTVIAMTTSAPTKGNDGGYASVSFADGGRYEEVAEAPAPKRHTSRRARSRTAVR